MAWAFIALLSGSPPHPQAPPIRADRLNDYRQRLTNSGEAAPVLLASWLRQRGERIVLRAHPDDLEDLRADSRAMLSGISDSRARLSATDTVEIWLRRFMDLERIRGEYLLIDDPKGNVVLHRGGYHHEETHAPLGLVIADLADWNGPREDGRVLDLLADAQ